MAIKSWAVGCVLAATTMAAQPLTLGKERGAAWIGQALELSVPVQLNPAETEVCAQADVFHADSRQDPARVRVTLEPAGAADARTLRIYSANPVDEPVVSVYLSTGCVQRSTRKYVLLADFPNSPVVPAVPFVPAVPAAPFVPEVPDVSSAPATSPAPVSTAGAPAPAASNPERGKNDAAQAKVPKAAKPSNSGKPRLQLDPMDTLSGPAKLSESAPSTPAARDAERIARLQQDVRALLEQAAKNEASLLALQVQLLQAQAQPAWATGLLYALVALTLGCVLGIALMWLRGNSPRG
jgi:hypothetical protein